MANIPKVWNGTAFIELEAAATVGPAASTTVVGMVQLTDSISSTSTTTAATPNSVKSAYDLAGTAIPKNTVTTAGDILYASGSATVARLGIGTASQVLSVSAGVPAWTTPAAGGGITALGTVIASAGTAISFTSIPTTYKHLVLMWNDVTQSAAGQWNIRCNNDTTASYHYLWIRDGVVTGTTFGDTQDIFACVSNSTSTFAINRASGAFTFWNYAGSTIKLMTGIRSSISASARASDVVGNYLGTAAITQLDFIRSSTQTITGNFYLYGVS
jgi:hypothetical protein